MATGEVVGIGDIEAAKERLAGLAVRTPLLESARINDMAGGRVLLKPELLQRTGSFKFRGAWNCISQLDDSYLQAGVVAYSSGNHAQGVAAAAGLRGMPAVIVMPSDTPDIKKANTRWLGAEIIEYDRASEDREEIGRRISRERGAALVPPYDHPDVIAGQGTVGLEIAEDTRDLEVDAVIVPAGGGGLTAGVAVAVSARMPDTAIYCAEPEGFDDHARSLRSARREENPSAMGSICDALLAPMPGELTFSLNQPRLAGGLAVSDSDALGAMAAAFSHLKVVLEPGGSVALAAVLAGKLDCRGKTVVAVLSGGNADPAVFCRAIGS